MKPKNPIRDAFEREFDIYNTQLGDMMSNFLKQFDNCELVKEKPLPRLFIRKDWRENLRAKGALAIWTIEQIADIEAFIEIKIEEVE